VVLGRDVYLFGGMGKDGKFLNSIERLKGRRSTWELVKIKNPIPARLGNGTVAISDD
jgi:hypothetical protein